MIEIIAYKAADGIIFEDEDKAKAHDVDLIGEELDGLVKHILQLDVPAHHMLRGFLAAIKSRKELTLCIAKLNRYLSHGDTY